ncbi:MAG TPA: hypothetical protein VEB23_03110 [Ramlibacter sp.]|nr:hypothetical protein [Ramlibacter sp.]
MKRILTIAAFAAVATGAWAQAKAPAEKPAAEKPGAEQPAAEARQPQPQAEAPKMTVTRKPNPRRFEDARHCLEKGTNSEIIKCAEVYL